MALTGLDIFKLLPKTNCRECGSPTCLAFAMLLAQKKVELSKCPHVSEAAKAALASAAAPPIRKITIGTGPKAFAIGEETQLYRHEGKFNRPCGVGITIADNLDHDALSARLKAINDLQFRRVGQDIAVNMVVLINQSSSAATFAKAAAAVAQGTELPIMLCAPLADNLKAALEPTQEKKPVLHAATTENAAAVAALGKSAGVPVVARAENLEALADLTEQIKVAGVEDILLDVTAPKTSETLQRLTIVRRLALKKNFRSLGYPMVVFAQGNDPADLAADAAAFVAKYAGIVVLDSVEPYVVLPVLTARQNIYTDPQKPIQVEAKLYEIGEPGDNSPVMFTTNFSLTYFSVEGDVESARIPAYIIAVDTEGTSVLTAYSGDKLNEKVVAKAIKACGIEQKVKHRKLIIPGYVAVMSGKLEEETGWKVLVGPKESSQLPAYLKMVWAKEAVS